MDTTTEQTKATKSRTFYEIVLQRLDWQMDNATAVDQKIAAWFQSAPVVITLLVGLLGFLKDGVNAWVAVLAAIGLVLFSIAMLLFFIAQNPRMYKQGLNWQDVAEDVANDELSEGAFHYRYAYYVAKETLPNNENVIKGKIAIFRWATAIFAFSVLLLLVAILISLTRSH